MAGNRTGTDTELLARARRPDPFMQEQIRLAECREEARRAEEPGVPDEHGVPMICRVVTQR